MKTKKEVIDGDIHDRKPTLIMEEEDLLIPRLERIKELEEEVRQLKRDVQKYKELWEIAIHPHNLF